MIICLSCLILLFLEANFGICLGCSIYNKFNKNKSKYCYANSCNYKNKDNKNNNYFKKNQIETKNGTPPSWAIKIGHAELWKKHHGCS